MASRLKEPLMWLSLGIYFGIWYLLGETNFHVEKFWTLFTPILIVMSLLLILAFDRLQKDS